MVPASGDGPKERISGGDHRYLFFWTDEPGASVDWICSMVFRNEPAVATMEID